MAQDSSTEKDGYHVARASRYVPFVMLVHRLVCVWLGNAGHEVRRPHGSSAWILMIRMARCQWPVLTCGPDALDDQDVARDSRQESKSVLGGVFSQAYVAQWECRHDWDEEPERDLGCTCPLGGGSGGHDSRVESLRSCQPAEVNRGTATRHAKKQRSRARYVR